MVYMCHILFVQSIIYGYLGWFLVFAIVNSAYLCMCLYNGMIYNPSGYIPSNGIAGLNGISISKTLRNLHTVFHNGWSNYTRTNSEKLFLFLHILFSICLQIFLVIAILTGVRWYLNVVLICISLMTSDESIFFICLLASYMSSFENCLFISFAHFWMGLFAFL